MKIGITGARGFLGTAIANEARSRGWSVVAFSRNADRSVAGVDETRSLADREAIDLSGLDAVVHLAGEPIVGLWTKEKKRRIRESRIDLTSDLVAAMAAISRPRRPAVFVSASASGYYGDRGDDRLDEESDPGFGFLSTVCREWEEAAAPARKLGVRVVNPRIGIVIGKGGFLGRLRPIFRFWLGGRLGNGRQWMPWVHVHDLAKIFVFCIEEATLHGPVNCVAPEPVRNREFTSTYAAILGRKAFFPVPRFLLRRLPGGMGEIFLASQRADPVVAQAFGFEWQFSRIESALRDVEGTGGSGRSESTDTSESAEDAEIDPA